MATEQEPAALPGDIIQDHSGHIYLVTETHGWGVGAVQRTRLSGDEAKEHYFRLRHGDFFICGSAALLPEDVAEKRGAAVRTQTEIAREAASASDAKPLTLKSAVIKVEAAGSRLQSIINGGSSPDDLLQAQETLEAERAALDEALWLEAGVDPAMLARVLAL